MAFRAQKGLRSLVSLSRITGAMPVLVVGFMSVAISIVAWMLTAASEDRAFALEYAQHADSQTTLLQNGVARYLDKLLAVRAIFDASDRPISRDEFESFGKSLLEKNPAILNIGWIPRVRRGERVAHEQAAVRDGLVNYHILAIGPKNALSVSPEREEYFPKYYSTEERTSAAYGIDLGSESGRLRSLVHSRDLDAVSASPPVVLHIGNGDRRGFWAILPVYAHGQPHDTVEQRRQSLIGFVQCVFQLGAFVDSIIADVTSPANLYFFAPNAKLDDAPFYFAAHRGSGPIEARSQSELEKGLHRTVPLDIGDVQWTLVLTLQDPGLISRRHQRSSILLVCGLLLSVILTAFLWNARRNSQLLQHVNDKLQDQKISLDAALENMSQGLCMFDADGRIRLYNDRFTKLMEIAPEAMTGACFLDLIRYRQTRGGFSGDPEAYSAEVIDAANNGRSRTKVLDTIAGRALRIDDQPMANGGWVATVDDITESRKAQDLIWHMAHHDALTDLANRTLLIERLEKALTDLDTERTILALYFVDVDHFKDVNDSFGHDGGDLLLKTIAMRLRSVTGRGDLAARVGGDEFVVLQVGVATRDQAEQFLRRLVSAVTAAIKIGDQAIVPTVSIGAALAPEDGVNPSALFKSADLALYQAKADGRNCARFFTPGMGVGAHARARLDKKIRDAVGDDDFALQDDRRANRRMG
jgi:diguanylate cyclase (GGDEF)-like protein